MKTVVITGSSRGLGFEMALRFRKAGWNVVLNGVNIIDNQPILGCTGGAITSDEFVKGPI